MQIKYIINALEVLCPVDHAQKGDFTGWQIGNKNRNVKNIIITLDCSWKVIQKAIFQNCNLIITHHPLLWPNKNQGSLKQADKIQLLKKHKISVYSMHTNYDEKFLKKQIATKIFSTAKWNYLEPLIAWTKLAKPQNWHTLLNQVKIQLNLSHINYWHNGQVKNNKIAVIPGAGGFAIATCKDLAIDLIITGELKWSQWIECRDYNLNVITVGHHTEQFFITQIEAWLKNKIFNKIKTNSKIYSYWEQAVQVAT